MCLPENFRFFVFDPIFRPKNVVPEVGVRYTLLKLVMSNAI